MDEVGEIPLELQGKLLRALQERAFEPVGDDRTRHVDIRVIAATNRDLEAEVAAGRFRLDLFYRLSVFPLEVPPLRQRREDILPLARECLRNAAQKHNLQLPALSEEAEQALHDYDFPGNVRELQNILERALVLQRTEGGELALSLSRKSPSSQPATAGKLVVPAIQTAQLGVLSAERFRELERDNILRALDQCAWRIAGEQGAAKLLGLKPSTLTYQMKSLGIERRTSAGH